MMITFSSLAIRMTIATGLVFGAMGVCAFTQEVSNFAQSSRSHSELGARSAAIHTLTRSLNRTISPAMVKFNPQPNPEPSGTGGTGTR